MCSTRHVRISVRRGCRYAPSAANCKIMLIVLVMASRIMSFVIACENPRHQSKPQIIHTHEVCTTKLYIQRQSELPHTHAHMRRTVLRVPAAPHLVGLQDAAALPATARRCDRRRLRLLPGGSGASPARPCMCCSFGALRPWRAEVKALLCQCATQGQPCLWVGVCYVTRM